MGLKGKIPIKKIEGKSVCEKVEDLLNKDTENAYHVGGIMMEIFGVKEREINKPFSEWQTGLTTLYSRVRSCLEKMVKEGKINKKREGRADYYWLKR